MTNMLRRLQGGHNESVLCLDAVDKTLVSGGENGEFALWDLSTDTLITKCQTFPGQDCLSVCFMPNNNRYFCAAFGNTMHIYDIRSVDRVVQSLQPCEDEINQIVTSFDGTLIAACSDNGDVLVYKNSPSVSSAPKPDLYRTLRNKHTNICSTVCFRRVKPTEIFSGGFDCQLIHWDFAKIRSLNVFNTQELVSTSNSDGSILNPPFVHHMDASSDGSTLVCGLGNGYVAQFDCTQRNIRLRRSFAAHSQHISQARFLDAQSYVTGGNDGNIRVWSLTDEAESHRDNGDGSHVNGIQPEESASNRYNDDLSVPLKSISHGSKINWLLPITLNDVMMVLVADQSPDITVHPLN